jgi:hypothetical protein
MGRGSPLKTNSSRLTMKTVANPSFEGTPKSGLRPFAAAPRVKR